MTILPPGLFLAMRGREPAGTICSVVPKHRDRSALLATQQLTQRTNTITEKVFLRIILSILTWSVIGPCPFHWLVKGLPSPKLYLSSCLYVHIYKRLNRCYWKLWCAIKPPRAHTLYLQRPLDPPEPHLLPVYLRPTVSTGSSLTNSLAQTNNCRQN